MIRLDRMGKALLASLVALGLALAGCQTGPDTTADPQGQPSAQAEDEDRYMEDEDEFAEPRQDERTAPQHEGHAEPQDDQFAQPGDADVPASPEEVTDEQVESFAQAYVEVMNIQMEYEPRLQQATDPDEVAMLQSEAEAQIMQVVEEEDITIEEFNAIAEFLAYDEQLRNRVQQQVDMIVN